MSNELKNFIEKEIKKYGVDKTWVKWIRGSKTIVGRKHSELKDKIWSILAKDLSQYYVTYKGDSFSKWHIYGVISEIIFENYLPDMFDEIPEKFCLLDVISLMKYGKRATELDLKNNSLFYSISGSNRLIENYEKKELELYLITKKYSLVVIKSDTGVYRAYGVTDSQSVVGLSSKEILDKYDNLKMLYQDDFLHNNFTTTLSFLQKLFKANLMSYYTNEVIERVNDVPFIRKYSYLPNNADALIKKLALVYGM